MKRIFLITSALTALFFFGCSVKTTMHTFSENTNWLETKIEYPQFSKYADLNATIADYVESDYTAFLAKQKPAWEQQDDYNREFDPTYQTNPFGYIVTTKDTFVGKRYINVVLNLWTYTGGAHGSPILKSFVYDRKTKQFIKAPTEISGITYELLSEQCRAYLDEHLPSYETTDEYTLRRRHWIELGTEPNAYNFSVFTYDGTTLMIYFDVYQVAPYSEGIPPAVPIAVTALN